jgi:uncharacterized membrane protein (DUF106 family)
MQTFDDQINFFTQCLNEVRSTIHFTIFFAALFILTGLIGAIFINYGDTGLSALAKTLASLGSAITTAFSTFHLKDYPGQKNMIKILDIVINKYEKYKEMPEQIDQKDLEKFQSMYWALWEKKLGISGQKQVGP